MALFKSNLYPVLWGDSSGARKSYWCWFRGLFWRWLGKAQETVMAPLVLAVVQSMVETFLVLAHALLVAPQPHVNSLFKRTQRTSASFAVGDQVSHKTFGRALF